MVSPECLKGGKKAKSENFNITVSMAKACHEMDLGDT